MRKYGMWFHAQLKQKILTVDSKWHVAYLQIDVSLIF